MLSLCINSRIQDEVKINAKLTRNFILSWLESVDPMERDEISSVITMRSECAFIRNRDPTFPDHDGTQKREKNHLSNNDGKKGQRERGKKQERSPRFE